MSKNSFQQHKNEQKILERNFLLRTSNGVKKGFTLIEILVVIGVLGLLSATLIVYSRVGENQIILIREEARIISAIYRAKSLAVATYGEIKPPCGYGVHFTLPDTVIIFQENSPTSDPECSDIDFKLSSGENFEQFKLSNRVIIANLGATNLQDIVFIPPDPSVILNNDISKTAAWIRIETSDGQNWRIVKVNNAGQITTQ